MLPLEQLFRLAVQWFGADRRAPEWRRPTVEEAEAVFASVGLEGVFWKLR